VDKEEEEVMVEEVVEAEVEDTLAAEAVVGVAALEQEVVVVEEEEVEDTLAAEAVAGVVTALE